MIYMRIAEAFTPGGRLSMSDIWDRILGKSTENVLQGGFITVAKAPQPISDDLAFLDECLEREAPA